MKPLLICSLVLLLTGTVFGRWALIPTEKLLTETDLVVVARLSDVTKTTTKDVDYGSGILTVSEVLKGPATPGQKLTLEWANRQGISVRIDHTDRNGKTNIWLLQKTTNGTFKANYPGRVMELERRDEVIRDLKKNEVAAPHPITQQQAETIVANLAQGRGIKLDKYQKPTTSFDEKKREWAFFYTLKPPGMPGGHFSIIINENGEATFVPGE